MVKQARLHFKAQCKGTGREQMGTAVSTCSLQQHATGQLNYRVVVSIQAAGKPAGPHLLLGVAKLVQVVDAVQHCPLVGNAGIQEVLLALLINGDPCRVHWMQSRKSCCAPLGAQGKQLAVVAWPQYRPRPACTKTAWHGHGSFASPSTSGLIQRSYKRCQHQPFKQLMGHARAFGQSGAYLQTQATLNSGLQEAKFRKLA